MAPGRETGSSSAGSCQATGRPQRSDHTAGTPARGTHSLLCARAELARIIPACAGNATAGLTCRHARTDHPRVCGERETPACVRSANCGSSPRVRGTRTPVGSQRRPERIIPACAGNGTRCAPSRRRSADHPRVCGERAENVCSGDEALGSSPRVRGTPLQHVVRRHRHRIIPACAGNASAWRPGRPRRTDHPRVCRERLDAQGRVVPIDGSSPRVRGTRIRSTGRCAC